MTDETGHMPGFGEADLSSCDREPIHLPGAIQPHGVMLVLDRRELAILQVAGDTRFMLGIDPARMGQLTLDTLFDADTLLLLSARLRGNDACVAPSIMLDVRCQTGALPLDLTVHARDHIAIVEVEPARRTRAIMGDPLAEVKSMLAMINSASTPENYCLAAAVEIRRVTGFDRVMVYRFLHDDSGTVIAEDKTDNLASYLGLHYPASDIPKQARELYRRNWLRLIPNVDYTPAPLQPADHPRVAASLDMSDCMLRSVSPIHLEYLRNMGVTASMSVSIVQGGRLWGLIACHNYSPRYIAADQRVACELFAQIFSLQLEARVQAQTATRRIGIRQQRENMVSRLALGRDIASDLTTGTPTLMDIVPCGGVVLWFEGQLHHMGKVPPDSFVRSMVAWLDDEEREVFTSSHLEVSFPAAAKHAASAAGSLSISISRVPRDYIIWFRPEFVRSINWAGDPHKPLEFGPHGSRLTPRKSFEAWQADVRGQSEPWHEVDLEAAQALRIALLENVLKRVDIARREREAFSARQSFLMAELDHRVKNILANIQGLVHQTRVGETTLEGFAQALERRIRAMGYAHNLLSDDRWEGAKISRILHDELTAFRRERSNVIEVRGDDATLVPKAALPFSMVIQELAVNAVKHGALSNAHGSIVVECSAEPSAGQFVVSWREIGGPPVTPPNRKGFGSVIIERSLQHEIRGTTAVTFSPEGIVCRIGIPMQYIRAPATGAP